MRKYPSIPQPMVVRVTELEGRSVRAGESLEFGFRLFGSAIDFFPYLIYAVEKMGEAGLGADKLRFQIESVFDGENVIFDHSVEEILQEPLRRVIDVIEFERPGIPTELTLRMVTPLRLRTGGRINRSPTLDEILRASLRRLRIMSHFYGDSEICPVDVGSLIDEASCAEPKLENLRQISIHRTSTRQNRKMSLDAVVGDVSYELPSSRLVPWLRAACECHIGKAASFGFGRIECEVHH